MQMRHGSRYTARQPMSGFLPPLGKLPTFTRRREEGTLVQRALDGFKGVLVSDFYAAYDSIPCAQQKCLLHLMRDLNDAVLDNPYDGSIKTIATAFAELLRDCRKIKFTILTPCDILRA